MPNDDIVVDFDHGAFLRRILLFDRFIVESCGLAEIPHMVRLFGVDGVLALLRSGAMSIHCDACYIADVRNANTPINQFAIVSIRAGDATDFGRKAMRRVENIEGISRKKLVKLKGEIAKVMVTRLSDEEMTAVKTQANHELFGDPASVSVAASLVLGKKLGRNITTGDFSLRLRRADNGEIDAESDISRVFSMDDESARAVIAAALRGVASLNLRLAYMKNYSALSGMLDEERAVFEHRLKFLSDQFCPTDHERRLHRVVEIARLPDLSEVREGFRIERLLEIRESTECTEFRNWLESIDTVSDKEIEDRLRSFREQLASVFQSRVGKAVRFLAGTGVGIIPVYGLVGGPAVSAIDTFLLDRILKESGPHAFLSRSYPSLFQ
jgi:hypothetical protein